VQLEPAVLKEHFMTAEDERIRKEDMPERTQLRKPRNRTMDDIERREEANWILDQLQLTTNDSSPALDVVTKVLELLDIEKLEVPFIWAYRKDYVYPCLDRDQLWRIAALDSKWEALQMRKAQVMDGIERVIMARTEGADEEALLQAEQALQQADADVANFRSRLEQLQGQVRCCAEGSARKRCMIHGG
jgi:transcription elongation factor SPT6